MNHAQEIIDSLNLPTINTMNKENKKYTSETSFTVDGLKVMAFGRGIVSICPTPQNGGTIDCSRNPELIADSFNTFTKCDKIPSELLSELTEAKALLKETMEYVYNGAYEEASKWGYKDLTAIAHAENNKLYKSLQTFLNK